MKNGKKKKPNYAVKNCGGKKCGSAFEWKVIDFVSQPQMKKAA